MTAANVRPFRMTGSMLVRRIVRVGPKFICGICRTHHKEPQKANNCLYNCWHDVKSVSPIIPVRRVTNLIQFACIYCLRSYDHQHHATTCAADCFKTMKLTYYNGAPIPDGRLKRNWGPQPAPAPIAKQVAPAPVAKIIPTPIPVVNPPPVVVKAPEPVAVSPQPETQATAPLESTAGGANVKRKNGRTKKFERAGAKYVCEVCQEKYFTKSEVEACFEGHPD